MTTVVSNAHASTIWAHVDRGALAPPEPEHTLRYFYADSAAHNINEHVALQTLDYRRRRRDFLGVAYATSQDAIRGKIPQRIARDEDQQRGHRHVHINELSVVGHHMIVVCPHFPWSERSPLHCPKYLPRSS